MIEESWASGSEDDLYNLRRYNRGDVRIVADVREKGFGHHKAVVEDLSRSGCRINTPMYLNPDRALYITIPGFSALEARIAWRRNDEYGCQFVNELHEAIFDHIVSRHPSLAAKR